MSRISEVDKNFEVKTQIEKDDIKFYSIKDDPFKIYGIAYENGKYRRMPEKVAESVSEGVYVLHANTAGGRVRFVTDSSYIAINVKMDGLGKMPHFAFTGSMGFDLYKDNTYIKTFVPPFDITDGYESIIELGEKRLCSITINFPLYSNVSEMYIGLQEGAVLKESDPYTYAKPVVYYGSSITQGGCASRPGSSYQSVISRKFDCDYINLGFSGNAKGEDEIAEYIKNLDMSIFVYDYDYNAPTVGHLENTHEKMFKTIRSAHPDIPIIIMPAPIFIPTKENEKRAAVVEKTYKNAVAANDKNVYYISGRELMTLCENEGTVDNCHPTDFGFASMAEAVIRVIEKNNLFNSAAYIK